MAIFLPVLILFAAFAINLAYMELNRSELYIAADAAARAAGRELAISGSIADAQATARDAASRNPVAGLPLQLADADFVFGRSNRSGLGSRYDFTPGGTNPNAVQITARRTSGSLDGPIQLLMPNVFGINQVEPQMMSQSTQIEVDVALVLDRSGSMAYAPNEPAVYPPVPAAAPAGWTFCNAAPTPSRWRDAVQAVDVFLNSLSNSPAHELVSLSTYNGTAFIDKPLTTSYGAITAAMDVYTQSLCLGSTNIGGGIQCGVDSLAGSSQRPWAAKVIVVLTDGIQTTVGGIDPVTAAADAADQGIMIFTVTFSDEADQSTMHQVAQIGMGQHFHATSSADLITVFQVIAKKLPTLLTR